MLKISKTIPATQVKNNFGMIVNRVYSGEYPDVIIENHGEPMAAIITVKDLRAMREFKEQEKRKEALVLLRKARDQVQARLKGKMTDQKASAIADRSSRELAEDIEKEGKVNFERKSS